jgi:hypothetical protein
MMIDEAIAHAEAVAQSCDGECADDHRQLAEWLKELKQWQKLVEEIDLRPESLMKPLRPNLEHENAKLRELVETMRVDMYEMLDIMIRSSDVWGYCRYYAERLDAAEGIMRELGIEMDE